MDEIIERNIEKQTSYLVGKYDGIEQGRKEGSQIKVKEIVKNMLDDKFPLDIIAKTVGLSVKEIKSMVL